MKYMDALAFSKETNIPYTTVISYMNKGKIDWETIGNRYMIPCSELQRLDGIEHPRTTAARLVGSEVMSPGEVAKLLNTTKPQVILLCKTGNMKHVLVGGCYLIPEPEVVTWLGLEETSAICRWCRDNDGILLGDVAKMTGRERKYQMVLQDANRGKLRAVKKGGTWCVRKCDAIEYVKQFF